MKSYAVITGASKGIGKAMAYSLASRNYNLLLVARSATDLNQLKKDVEERYGIRAEVFPVDLAVPGAALEVKEWINGHSFPVSVLINNAGYGLWGPFENLELDQQLNMLQLNINTVIELTFFLLPLLKKESASFILNVSSTAAYQSVPTLGLYAASKAFVLSFSRSLRYELKNSPVSVTCLCPGPVDTGFAERAGLNALSKMAARFNMQPAEVAEIAVKGMFSRKSEIIPGAINVISAYANRFLPKSFIENAAAGIYKTD